MENPKRPPYLRLVVPPAPRLEPLAPPAQGQLQLFPREAPTLLVIADISLISEAEMLALLCDAPPRWLLDLRPSPRFDFGRLNRARVFRLFEQKDIRYHDVCGLLDIYSRQDASFSSGRVATEISRLFIEARADVSPGKVIVLVDTSEIAKAMALVLPAQIAPAPSGGWVTSLFTSRAAHSWSREG